MPTSGGAGLGLWRILALAAVFFAVSAVPAAADPSFQDVFGSAGSGNGDFERPSDVAVTAAGDVWVVDQQNYRLEKFNDEGEYLSQFGTIGTEEGLFADPVAVDIDDEGNIWVADQGNDNVQKFDEEGEFLLASGSGGSAPGKLANPSGLAVDGEGDVWVADTTNGRLQEFDGNGELMQVVGTHGSGEGQLGEPVAVDIAINGDVYVADWTNQRVAVFNQEGEFLRQFGSPGTGAGEFENPGAIDVDSEGNVWVGDEINSRVQQFSESGEYLNQFGSGGGGGGQFHFGWPFGLTTDLSGNIWIADSENDRVQRWTVHTVTCDDRSEPTGIDEPLVLGAGALGCEGTEPLEYELVSGPGHGEITGLNAETGALTYTPDLGFAGFDVFTFRAKNAFDVSGPAKFRLQVGDGLIPIYSSTFGSAGTSAGEFQHPGDLALTEAGDLWVVDELNNRLQKFNSEGEYLASFGSSGLEPGEFERPTSVAIDGGGNLWVADAANNRVQKFDEEGGLIGTIGTFGSSPGQFFGPEGVAVDEDDDLWVADTYNGRLQEFDETGELIQVVGSPGSEAGQLKEPTGIDVAANGDVYVVDWGNHRVSEFDQEGEFLHQFGSRGSGPGQFEYPDSIDVDSEGEVWVGDELNYRVERFDESGEYLGEFGHHGIGKGEFDFGFPFGVARDESGHIWVSDSNNDRVQKWTVHGVAPSCDEIDEATDADQPLVLGAGSLGCSGTEPISYEIVSDPARGEIDDFDPETGALTYLPESGFSGGDSFTFRAKNGFGSSEVTKFHILVGNGLVAAYSFDEGEGEAVHDATGDHDGTIEGAEWVGGKFGDALRFKAEDEDSVTIPASDELDLTSAFTLEAWVRPSTATWQPVVVKEAPSSLAYGLYAAGNTELKPKGTILDESSGESEAEAEEAIAADDWSHLALASDGEDLRLYVNGELVDTVPARSARLSEGDLRIGGHDAWNHWFDGLIDEVRIYNRALGAEEISADRDSAIGVSMLDPPEIWGSAMVSEELRALGGRWSSGSEVEREFVWLRCDEAGEECEPIEIPEWADSRSLRLTSEDVGHRIRVRVIASAGGFEDTAVSVATGPVLVTDAPEVNGPTGIVNPLDQPQALLVPGVFVSVNERLSGWYPYHTSLFAFEAFGPPGLDYQWERCSPAGEECEEIEGATSGAYQLTEEDVGHTLRRTTQASNSSGSASVVSKISEEISPLSPPVAPSELLPPGTWPPPPREKDTLQVPNSTWGEASGFLSQWGEGERSYQWLRCDAEGESCTEIPESNSTWYVLTSEDVGHSIRVRVEAVNDAGEDEVTSEASEVIDSYTPEEPELHAFESGMSTDQPLKGYPVDASFYSSGRHGQGETTYGYQWFRCDAEGAECRTILGADEWRYFPTGLDLGHALRVRVRLQDEGGKDEALSEAGQPVKIASDPAVVGQPTVQKNEFGGVTLTGNPRVGMELRAGRNGVWSGAVLDFVGTGGWQWQRCSIDETECEDIAGGWMGGDNSFYVPRWRDIGHRLRVKGVVRGPKGDYPATSKQTGVVQPGAPLNLEEPTVLGGDRIRERFTADEGIWNLPEVWFQYQWLRCSSGGGSCVEISGATSRTYLATSTDLGSTLRVRVGASYGSAGPTWVTSTPSEVLGEAIPPESADPPTIEGPPNVDAWLKGEPGTWKGALPMTFEWQWLRCDEEGEECKPIEGATKQSRTVQEADLGATLRLEVTATDDLGSDSARSAPTEVITLPDPPSNAVAPTIEGSANVGETLTGDAGEWSSEPQEFEFQWQLCDAEGEGCEDAAGATKLTFRLPATAEGGRAKLLVTARNRGGEDTAESEPSDVVGAMLSPASESPPYIPGSAREGRLLASDVGNWSGGRPLTYTYQWLRCDSNGEECTKLSGATMATYTPVAADLGLRLRVEVTATNEAGNATEVSSESGKVQRGPPRFVSPPSISGELKEGSEVSADLTSLLGSIPMEIEYEWQRCFERCVAIPAAESQTYTITATDVAHRLRVNVAAENDRGEASRISLYSDFVEPLEASGEPIAAEPPALDGMPRVTETLTTTEGSWRGAPSIETGVRWQRCALDGESCADIEGAEETEYDLVGADVGSRLRAVVTGVNGEGSGEAESMLTSPILPAVNTAYLLDGEMTIEDVLQKTEAYGAPIVALSFYSEGESSLYSGGIAGTMSADVSAALNKRGIDQKAQHVRSVTLSGSSDVNLLWGGLPDWIPHVDDDEEEPSIFPTNEPVAPTPEEEEIEEEEENYVGSELVSEAELAGIGWPCAGEECNEESKPEWSEELWYVPRQMMMSFEWGQTEEEMDIWNEEFGPIAMEFDVKLYNPDNDEGGKAGVTCSDQEESEFWINDRDDEFFTSDFDADVGVYWDTGISDPCTEKDLTFGVMHPENLEFGETYGAVVGFSESGEQWESPVKWTIQLLERVELPIGDCDFNLFCVNIPGFDGFVGDQPLIELDQEFVLPGCYEYKGGRRRAEECSFPT
jgi:DNA-binding beta-propeller fold protein YncE